LQAHLKAALANATPKLLKELAKTSFVDLDEKIWSHPDNFKITSYNSDGLLNCLCQPGLLLNRPQKSMREKFNLLIKSCGTQTVPAAETKSIGLAANARGVMVFAILS
jgi:hypothetical protein